MNFKHLVPPWDSIRKVKLVGGATVVRRTLLIKPEHIGIRTMSMGPIQRYDVGRELVMDTDCVTKTTVDVIQDPKPKTPAEVEAHEVRQKIAANVRATIAKYTAILNELEGGL